jgi:glycosyltransferase involved in cell wall biosynthesis
VREVPTALAGGHAGVLVPPGDAPALAGAVARVLSDPAQARRLGEAAALRAAAEYTLGKTHGALRSAVREAPHREVRGASPTGRWPWG